MSLSELPFDRMTAKELYSLEYLTVIVLNETAVDSLVPQLSISLV